jgi:hypothetical protein
MNRKKKIQIVIGIFILLAVIISVYFYLQKEKVQPEKTGLKTTFENKNKIDDQSKKKKVIDNINDYLVVEANDEKPLPCGGYNNLKMTMTNYSEYNFEKIDLTVLFLLPSWKTCHVETLHFKDLKHGEYITLNVPPSGCGVYLKWGFSEIHSKDLNVNLVNDNILDVGKNKNN